MQIQEELIRDLDTCLTDCEPDLCEGFFTKEELFTALSGLQTGKPPGSDGLRLNFIVLFGMTLVILYFLFLMNVITAVCLI